MGGVSVVKEHHRLQIRNEGFEETLKTFCEEIRSLGGEKKYANGLNKNLRHISTGMFLNGNHLLEKK